ncbi:MAG: heparinase II/III family protein [Rikenellaceae bacterium]
MKLNLCKSILLLLSLAISSCSSTKDSGLDIAQYLSLATSEDSIYPSAEQIALLEEFIPESTYTPAPAISNREYWEKIAASQAGKDEVANALAVLDEKPTIPISDEIYRQANAEGNRGLYKTRYYTSMARLESYLLAECIQNQGVFIPQIETYTRAILDMKSWLHPNHDDDDNGVLEGRRVSIDLGARKFGSVLTLVNLLLEDKISTELRDEISTQVRWRIIESYLNSCSGEDKSVSNDWLRKVNNWNSVCTSGAIFTTIANSEDRDERIAAIGCALNGMRYYLTGFGEDGYCSEGFGYWNYGFGHYLYLAHILSEYTNGAIDLFTFDNPEKLVKVAHFPQKYEIQNSLCSAFSDGSFRMPKEDGDNFASVMCAKYYGTPKPKKFNPDQAVLTIIGWDIAPKYTDPNAVEAELPEYSYFDKYGIVISRGKQDVPFSVAIKSGHNAENHNHCDVGSYYILLGSDRVAGDIGSPVYIGHTPSIIHPARNSWGHPVPRINDTLQSIGREFKGTITKTEFIDGRDFVEMELKEAYEIPSIQSLTRTLTNDKSGSGKITVVDKFVADEALIFGTAVMVNTKYEIKGETIYIYTDNHKIRVDITANGAPIKIKDEEVLARMSSGKVSYRIGIDFTQPLKEGSIEVTYTPEL